MAALSVLARIAARIVREGSVLSHQIPVHPGLVRIVHGTQIQHDGLHQALFKGRRNHHVDAVPANAVGTLQSQRLPGLINQGHLPPRAVIQGKRIPGRVVPLLETTMFNGYLLSPQYLGQQDCQKEERFRQLNHSQYFRTFPPGKKAGRSLLIYLISWDLRFTAFTYTRPPVTFSSALRPSQTSNQPSSTRCTMLVSQRAKRL